MNCRIQESRLSLTQADTIVTNTQGTQLSYRQNRRLQQANRAAATTDETHLYYYCHLFNLLGSIFGHHVVDLW